MQEIYCVIQRIVHISYGHATSLGHEKSWGLDLDTCFFWVAILLATFFLSKSCKILSTAENPCIAISVTCLLFAMPWGLFRTLNFTNC